jgi:hypothetical protein
MRTHTPQIPASFGTKFPKMDAVNQSHRAIEKAVLQLLRPVVRLLLRHGVSFSAFQTLAKQAYVQAALTDFALPGKKPSVSRASILTGLTRKDVQRLLSEAPAASEEPAGRHNRAVRVLGGWTRDADFRGPDGQPRPLLVDGSESADGEPGFAALVRRHGADVPARAVLDELLRVGAVQRRADGRVEPAARGYVPQQSAVDKLHMLGTDVADLIGTIDHNLEHGGTDPRYQRKVMYRRLDPTHLPAFRALSTDHAQALLESLDRWLAEHGTSPPPEGAPAARAGLGIYYFEDVRSRGLSEGEAP